jgi:hypothetical protein
MGRHSVVASDVPLNQRNSTIVQDKFPNHKRVSAADTNDVVQSTSNVPKSYYMLCLSNKMLNSESMSVNADSGVISAEEQEEISKKLQLHGQTTLCRVRGASQPKEQWQCGR